MRTSRGHALTRWLLLAMLDHLHEEGWKVQPVALEDPERWAECDVERRVVNIYGHKKARDIQHSMLHEMLHVQFPHAGEDDVRRGELLLRSLLRGGDRRVLQALTTGISITAAAERAADQHARPRKARRG